MSWIRKLLGLCEHRWVILEKHKLTCNGTYYADQYILRCDRCGDMKSKEF